MLLKNKIAVVYGAGGSIGRAVAIAFAREGATVFLTGRTLAGLERVAKEIADSGGLCHTAQVDALDEQAVDKHVVAVVEHFVARCGVEMGKVLSVSSAAITALARYDFPGNVRELRNLVERAAAIADSTAELGPDDFDLDLSSPALAKPAVTPEGSLFEHIARESADQIRDALRQAGGSKSRAARILGIPRTTLNDRIERYGIR